MMQERFRQFIETLEQSFQRLVAMEPVTRQTLPSDLAPFPVTLS